MFIKKVPDPVDLSRLIDLVRNDKKDIYNVKIKKYWR